MSWATTTLIVLFFVNLGFFLLSLSFPNQYSTINSPMITAFLAFAGVVNWNSILAILPTLGAEITAICLILLGYSYFLNPQGAITGQPFAVVNLPLAIALSFFIVLCAVPNFGSIGIPFPLNTVIQSMFGMLIGLSIFGLFKGE